jgi:alpha-mannosidase
LIDTGWENLAARIDTRGEGIPICLFNPLGWRRTDIAEAEIGFGEPGVLDLSLVDAAGRAAPVQILRADRDRAGGIRGRGSCSSPVNVPALGYATYRVMPRRTSATTSKEATEEKEGNFIENEYYRAAFDLTSGAIIACSTSRSGGSSWRPSQRGGA